VGGGYFVLSAFLSFCFFSTSQEIGWEKFFSILCRIGFKTLIQLISASCKPCYYKIRLTLFWCFDVTDQSSSREELRNADIVQIPPRFVPAFFTFMGCLEPVIYVNGFVSRWECHLAIQKFCRSHREDFKG